MRRSAQHSVPRLLAIADPVIGEASPIARRCCGKGLAALPGARRESAALDALWRNRFGDAARATTLLGGDATEARLRALAGDADILHFGTHGISAGGDCSDGAAALAVRGFALAADVPLEPAAPAIAPTALLLSAGSVGGVKTPRLPTDPAVAYSSVCVRFPSASKVRAVRWFI